MALQLRRGTEAERASITPAEGELIYVTDTNRLYVGGKVSPSTDLETGGILLSAQLSEDTSPQLSANLDLNGHNIIGTGNISIDGTITATGNINLGDGAEDNIIVGGQISSSLIPGSSDVYNLGDQAGRWRSVNAVSLVAEGASINGEVEVGTLVTDGSIVRTDSSVLYDATLDSLTVSTINASSIDGDLTGSVFSDDSTTVMVDAVSSKITANSGSMDEITPTNLNSGFGDNTVRFAFNDNEQERITFEGITDGTFSRLAVVPFRAYKGTDLDNKADTTSGDVLGGFGIDGYRSTGYVNAVNILGSWKSDADFNEGFPGASLTYYIGSNNSTFPTQFTFDGGAGTFTAPVLKAGSYATLDIPTGADVGVGSIVFDSTTNEFKGWNGTSWVVLG